MNTTTIFLALALLCVPSVAASSHHDLPACPNVTDPHGDMPPAGETRDGYFAEVAYPDGHDTYGGIRITIGPCTVEIPPGPSRPLPVPVHVGVHIYV